MSIFSHRLYFTTFGVKISVFIFSTHQCGRLLDSKCCQNFLHFEFPCFSEYGHLTVTEVSSLWKESHKLYMQLQLLSVWHNLHSTTDLILTINFSKKNDILIQKSLKAFLLIACMLANYSGSRTWIRGSKKAQYPCFAWNPVGTRRFVEDEVAPSSDQRPAHLLFTNADWSPWSPSHNF